MNKNELTTVVYHFEDNSKVVQPINKEAFFNEKGKANTTADLHHIFNTTRIDKGAINYSLEGIAENVEIVKEQHFTKEQKKVAKRDYKEFQRLNPQGFSNSLKQFKAMVGDKFAHVKRLKFNLINLDCVIN